MTGRFLTQQREAGDGSHRTGRRTALKAGLLAALGLGAGSIFRGLSHAAFASDADAPRRTAKQGKGAVDPLVGELSRADANGYENRDGAWQTAVPSTCMQCIAACGIIGYRENGRIAKIDGNPHCPNNRGMVCAKS